MSFATPRYLRFLAWCRIMDERPTWLGMSYWTDTGALKPADRYAGTARESKKPATTIV